MTREELSNAIVHAVTLYTNSPEYFDSDPKIRINPATLDVTVVNGRDALKGIAFSDEAVEEAAAVDGEANEDAADFQTSQDPDFFAVKDYVRVDKEGRTVPDRAAITRLAKTYFD